MTKSRQTLGAVIAVGSLLALPGWARGQEDVRPDSYEPDNSRAEAKPLPLDSTRQARSFHVSGDNDWVSFAGEADQVVSLSTTGDCDTYLTLYGPDGTTVLAEDDDSGEGSNAMIIFALRDSGTYFARVRPWGSSSCASYELSGRARPRTLAGAPDAFEPDDVQTAARPLPLDGSWQDRSFHTEGDVDWVSFQLDAGDQVRLTTRGACETRFAVYEAGQQSPASSGFGGGGSGGTLTYSLSHTASASGTYYGQIQPQAATPTCAAYQLSGEVTRAGPPDAYEPDDSRADAKPLALDGTLQERSFHVPGDHDWVSLRVETNQQIRLSTRGSCDTYLTLYAPNGVTVLAEDDDSGEGSNALVMFTFPEAGAYYAMARPFASSTCLSYQLTGTVGAGAQPELPGRAAPPPAGPTATPTTDQAQFLAAFRECRTASVTVAEGGAVADHAIIGPSGNLCEVRTQFLQHPNPAWVGPQMICQYDPRRDFEPGAAIRCAGPLFDLLRGSP